MSTGKTAAASRPDPRKRHRARRALLQAVYQWQLNDTGFDAIESQFREGDSLVRADVEFFKECLSGVMQDAEALDALYQDYLDRSIDQLNLVERAILRAGTYELKVKVDVPYRVVINEWVNLAKDFGAEGSFKYVNGILDHVSQDLRDAEFERPAEDADAADATDEFALIDAIIQELGDVTSGTGVVHGPGDDAAVLNIPASHDLVVSTDTLIADQHYPRDADPELIACRSLSVTISDLAAMGATPRYAVVALATEEPDPTWMTAFARGLARRARDLSVKIVGGNIARGPQHVAITVHGSTPKGVAITRAKAKEGDDVWVSGSLGGATLALGTEDLAGLVPETLHPDTPAWRYWMPEPRIALGEALRGVATAMIDISDGIASDLGHICKASGLGCTVEVNDLPVFDGIDAIQAAVSGDDYELVFCASPRNAERVQTIAETCNVPVTKIAQLQTGGGLRWQQDGKDIDPGHGYRHF